MLQCPISPVTYLAEWEGRTNEQLHSRRSTSPFSRRAWPYLSRSSWMRGTAMTRNLWKLLALTFLAQVGGVESVSDGNAL